MNIKLSPFSPLPGDTRSLEAFRQGDVLTINGQSIDFSVIPDGATLPADAIDCEWITGNVERINGVLHITLIFPHGADASEAARFPEPIVDPADGNIDLPQ